MNKQQKQAGSALIWVVVAGVIFAIMGTSIAWMAVSMNKRTVNNYILRQSYFSSRSAVDTIYECINGYDTNTEKLYDFLSDHVVYGNDMVTIKDFYGTCDVSTTPRIGQTTVDAQNNVTKQTFDDLSIESTDFAASTTSDMGNCTVKVQRQNGRIYILAKTIQTTEDTTGETVSLTLKREVGSQGLYPSPYWGRTLGDQTEDENAATDPYNAVDVAVYTVSHNLSGKLAINVEPTSASGEIHPKKAIFIYIEPGVTLTLTDLYAFYASSDPSSGTAFSSYKADQAGESAFLTDSATTQNRVYVNWETYDGPDIFIYLMKDDDNKKLNGKLVLKMDTSGTNTTTNTTGLFPIYVLGAQQETIAGYEDADYWNIQMDNSKIHLFGLSDNIDTIFVGDDSTELSASEIETHIYKDMDGNQRATLSGYNGTSGSPSTVTPTDIKAATTLNPLADHGGLINDEWSVYRYSNEE